MTAEGSTVSESTSSTGSASVQEGQEVDQPYLKHAAALQAEVAGYIDAHADQFDEPGHRLVVRNGGPVIELTQLAERRRVWSI